MKKIIFLLAFVLMVTSVAALELPPGLIKMQEYQQQLALSITFLIAFIGGVISFTSPCGFVVLPTFFAYLFKERKRALFMTAIFSLGMTLAFIIFGIIAGLVGDFFNLYKEFFASLSGGIMIIFGLMLIFNKGFSIIDFRMKHKPDHGWGTFFLGFFFAVGWTPCVGPILGGMILLAADTGNMLQGGILFAFYALGVALPLMIVSYFSDKYDVAKWFQSRHVEFKFFGTKIYTHLYGIVGGILLILVGLIMFFGQGTGVFMNTIPNYIPWTMDSFTIMNEKLVESTFFTSSAANIIGGVIVLIMLLVMYKAIFHHRKK